ncbi:MAG: alpha-hydroxy-acid oxidizing protein [Burkholderiales bacterium]
MTAPSPHAAPTAALRTQLPRRLRAVRSLEDFEAAARRHLPAPLFGYIHAAADGPAAARRNREAFDEHEWLPSYLQDVSARSMGVELLGRRWALPFGIAPMGLNAMSAYRGDLVLAQAAAAAGIPMVMSGSSLMRLEDIVAANPQAWFQAYVTGDMKRTSALLERVARAGYDTLVITIDVQAPPNIVDAYRAGFTAPLRPSLGLAWQGVSHPRWLLGTFARTLARHGMPHFENNDAQRGAPVLSRSVMRDFADRGTFTPEHLRAIRREWPGQLVVKGVLTGQDARRAADCGADAIIVSNHGGRQLAGARATLRALPEVVAAVPQLPVMLDSGVRRGTDVMQALALGARMVFVGRPFIPAAAVAATPGVRHAIDLLAGEVSRTMGMLGVIHTGQLHPGLLVRRPSTPHFTTTAP